MFVFTGNTVCLLFFIFFHLTLLFDYAPARITSIPHQRYVPEGRRIAVTCQNRSDDETVFYSYIVNADWYQDQNNIITKIGSSGPVYADRHLLRIPSITKNEEGVYYCCIPNGPCGNSTSASTTVQIATPPIIAANYPKYTTTVGSQVTLTCDIIDRGSPPATFGWTRDGHDLSNDHPVIANHSVVSLTLNNVKLSNTGNYTCTASNAGFLHHSDTVELYISDFPSISPTTSSESYSTYLQSKDSTCHHMKLEHLNKSLKYYTICNCSSYTVKVECNDTTSSGAVYNVQIVGPFAGKIIQSWLQNALRYLEGDVSSIINMPTQTPTNKSDQNSTETSAESSLVPIIVPTGIVIIVLISALIIGATYYLCRNREGKWNICTAKYIKSKDNFTDGAGQVVKLPDIYKKHPKRSSSTSTKEKSTKHDHTIVSNEQAINAMKDGRTNAKRKPVLYPPVWDIDMESVAFTPSKVHIIS